MRNFILLAGLLVSASAFSALGLNDVSILLPVTNGTTELFVPLTAGVQGALLPERVLNLIPVNPRSNLAVVGIRLDPCFRDASLNPAAPDACDPQIRMIWQPINSMNFAADMAIHTFYRLTASEFSGLIRKIEAIPGRADRNAALGLHPTIASQGLKGEYWQKLRTFILEYTGEKNLVRFTFMQLEIPDEMWTFGGFDVIAGKITRMVIPRVMTRMQSFVNKAAGPGGATAFSFIGGFKPEPQSPSDNFNRLVADSDSFSHSSETELRQTADSLFRIENPRLHSPATIDCASCHLAQSARNWLEVLKPALNQSQFQFTSALNLSNGSAARFTGRTVRVFGYFGQVPLISQRVINETAAVVETLNR